MRLALNSFLAGCRTTIRAPALVIGVFAASTLFVLPFAVALSARLSRAIVDTPLADPSSVRIAGEAWHTAIAQATGIGATFAPWTMGFAAPLENLSSVADRVPPSPALAALAASYLLFWVFLWGGALARLSRADARGVPAFIRAGVALFVPLLVVATGALVVQALLFLVVHPWLFGTAADWISFAAETERSAAAGRIALYAVFGLMLATLAAVVDLTRVHVATTVNPSIGAAVARTMRLLRSRPAAVISLWVLNASVLAFVLALYAAFDWRARGVPRVWTAIAIGQLYIAGRVAARILAAASQVHFVRQHAATDVQT